MRYKDQATTVFSEIASIIESSDNAENNIYDIIDFMIGIMTNTWLNDSAPKQLFKDKDLQLLMFDKRMKFLSPDGRDNDKITFSSSYYCWNFLPKQIIMEELNIVKSKTKLPL